MIVKDSRGNELLEIIYVDESEVDHIYENVTHSLVVIKIGDEYLMGWNHWRKNWEIFGGCREKDESIRDCIIREGFEEVGLENVEYTYIGLMHYKMAPGYFHPEWHEEYGALYGITLPVEMMEEIEKHRTDKKEVESLTFYSKIEEKESIATIDEALLKYWDQPANQTS